MKWPKRGIKLKEGPFAGMTARMPKTDGVDKYYSRLAEMILEVFDIRVAMMTDLSTLSDFGCTDDDLRRLEELYGVMAERHDTLLSVAERIWGVPPDSKARTDCPDSR